LLKITPQGTLVPGLASSWKQTNATTFTFTIRQGVKFWDGNPLTADDIVYSMSQHLKPSSQLSRFYASVTSITSPNPQTVVIKLKHPDPSAAFIPTGWLGAVIEKKYWQ